MRTHIHLPDELVFQVDSRVGHRNRSRFICEAIAEKLRRHEQLERLDQAIGEFAEVDVPGWETEESTLGWVRAQRRIGGDLLDSIPG